MEERYFGNSVIQLYDGTLVELKYFLSVGTENRTFGITVTKRIEGSGAEVAKFPELSPSEAYVAEILVALQYGTVTPLALPDVLEDLTSSGAPAA